MHTPKTQINRKSLPPDRRPARGFAAKSAGSFVPRLAAKAFEKYGFHSAEIMTSWQHIIGADLAGFTAPERIRWPRSAACDEGKCDASGATLVIRVEPARALDAEYRSGEIIERINRYFGYRAIAVLRILQAPLAKKQGGVTDVSHGSPPQTSTHPPSDELESALDALKANIKARRPGG